MRANATLAPFASIGVCLKLLRQKRGASNGLRARKHVRPRLTSKT
jgi:hypothetical protein